MSEQYEHLETAKPEYEAVFDPSAELRLKRVAEEAAEQASMAVKGYDEKRPKFSK